MGQSNTPGLSVEIADLQRIPDESIPTDRRCGFAYTIRILNNSHKTVQLLGRKWMIKQTGGELETVEGDGVVGVQPIIEPGGEHIYTSYCFLTGDHGSMWGLYFGEDEDKLPVIWEIPKFDMSIETPL